jgi:transcriptional regulator with XRE-family HTH domain
VYNGLNIRHIAQAKGYAIKEVLEGTKMARPTFNSMTNEKGNPNAKNIEAIADFLRCSVDDFFDRDVEYASVRNVGHTVNGDWNQVSGNISLNECRKEIEHLKELLAEKERLIQVLMKEKQ